MKSLISRIATSEPRDFTQQQQPFFESKIRPVLVEHCHECHAARAMIVQGGLYVDHRVGLTKGGDSGPAVTDPPIRSIELEEVWKHWAFPPVTYHLVREKNASDLLPSNTIIKTT